tara:strand:+ start:751 stop:984 length:234 start_codon:yes stop_codon:yes gene_type:complete
MIHKISLWENVSNLVEVRFFTNKNKAIQYGKEQSKNLSYENEWGESLEVVYEIQSVKKPKTQKEWMMFLNFHSYTEG